MNVLVLDRCSNPGLRNTYTRKLRERGHTVTNAQLLMHVEGYLEARDTFLGRYDVAVVHPHWSCFSALEEELRRREEFRVMIFKLSGPSEMNGRLVYRDFLDEEGLIEFVEGNGS